MQKATRQFTKEHNRDLVLKIIFENEKISRAEIARITQLTRTTVSDIVASQIAEGLVEEVGLGSSQGGKSPILLSLVDDARYLIGLNLAQDEFCGGVVNLRGEIKDTVSIPVANRDGDQALASVYEVLDRLIQKPWKPVVGIGVSTPGLVDSKEGTVVRAVNLDWKDLPLAALLQSRYGLPVSVLNDSQAAAMGEYVYGGDHASAENLIVINVKHGIGAGIVINRRLFQGDGGGAGEIGHVVMQEDGPLCRCGNRGCLEAIASARAVVQRVRSAAGAPGPILRAEGYVEALENLKAAFTAGDPIVREAVLEAGHYLGLAAASLVGTLNIQKIVFTGDMTRFGQPWLEAVHASMLGSTLGKLAQDTRIEIGNLDVTGSILGASATLIQNGYSMLYASSINAHV